MSEPSRSVGIISAPGYPNDIASKLKEDLPDLLRYYIDGECGWKVNYIEDPLPGAGDSLEILKATKEMKYKEEWDFAICLTDLPLFKGKRSIIADVNEEENVALISMPSLGSLFMIRRLRESILQLINEMYYGVSDDDRKIAELHLKSKRAQRQELKNKNSKRLISERFFETVSPIQRETPEHDESNIDVRFTVARRWNVALRIITGMVRANRPWLLFPAFMKVIVLAFTAGSYALIFPTIWQLSNHYSILRMSLLSVFTILAMASWIILAHRLWERRKVSTNSYLRRLYNTTTFLTLLLTVCLYYLILFCMFSVAVFIFIPMGMLSEQLSSDISVINYFYIAWTATSFSTVIGAIGSVLEDEDVVLSSTYGYRQRQRHKRLKEKEEQEEVDEDQKDTASEED